MPYKITDLETDVYFDWVMEQREHFLQEMERFYEEKPISFRRPQITTTRSAFYTTT